MSFGNFFGRVLSIDNPEAARRFFDTEIAFMRAHYNVGNPEFMLRENIGWVFGEGMSIERRRMWRDVCGAEHPGLGPEYTDRDFTAEECLQAGMKMGKRKMMPTAWARILADRFGD